LKKRDGENAPEALAPGTYLLQVTVSTFQHPQSLANNLKSRWKETGVLWSESVTSTPMRFKVKKDRQLVDCNP